MQKFFQNCLFSLRHLFSSKKRILIPFLLLFTFALGIGGAYLSTSVFSNDARFQKLSDKLFREEVSASTLTLHYTLADPEGSGIHAPEPTLGTLSTDVSEACSLCHTYESRLLSFDPQKLTRDHQIARDSLLLYFHTQQDLLSHPLFYEPLSPSLGIQAQLPVLLAEYTFYDQQDILDYLKLLTTIKPYFESILSYEQEKSAAGLFMSDTTLDRIQTQCKAFISNPDKNYMQEIFKENLNTIPSLRDTEKKKLLSYHQNLIKTEILPAYQLLIQGLEKLRGTGKNALGLAGLPEGQTYYEALFRNETGVYSPVAEVEQRLSRQLLADAKQISLLLKEQPSLINKLGDQTLFRDITPDEILLFLKDAIETDFPPLPDATPELRTVHPSMQEYLSPAFYLTPPMDTGTPNVIYLNEKNHARGLELFTTLAHEGFPGHLYQTVSFERENCSPIRYLFSTSGYTEGWATYIESWAANAAAPYIQDPAAKEITKLYALNRNINLCLYSLLDIGIHYHGWTPENTARFLSAFGIKDPKAVQEIFQYIVENPANYPKYYVGAMEFQRLKEKESKKQGKDFDLKDFHQKILSIGPVPFPVLEKYLALNESM